MLEVAPHLNDSDDHLGLDIYNAVWPHDQLTMEDVRAFNAAVRANVHYLARIDGVPVGAAVAVIFAQRDDRVFTIITVLASHRRQGAGTALYQAVSAWAAEQGLDAISVPVLDDDPGSLAFAGRRGFSAERHDFGLVLRLNEFTERTSQDKRTPDGIEIVTWAERPDLTRGIYDVAVEAEPDIPGFEDDVIEPYDDWLAHSMQGPEDSPEAIFLALAGDDVVGFAKFRITQAQPTIAHHDLSAVRRAWRGRGIARALKSAQITWAIDHGYTELHTSNEERNEPIRRLNARLGYRPAVGRIYLLGPLAPAVAQTPAGNPASASASASSESARSAIAPDM